MSDFPRDRWGRPMVTPPGGGKPVAYSRFSSFGSVLEDRYNLELWKVRTACVGLAQQPHLLAQVAACPVEDSKRLNKLCDEALKFGGSQTGAGLGTALHEFCARVAAGDLNVDAVIDPWGADVRAYLAALDAHGLAIVPDLVEVQLVNDALSLAGTCDGFLRRSDGRLVAFDLKTGKTMGDNPLGYIVQLAGYATGARYDVDTGLRDVARDFDQVPLVVDLSTGLLIHLPAGKATCTIYEVDLVAGMELAHLAGTVRKAQKRRDLLRQSLPGHFVGATQGEAGPGCDRYGSIPGPDDVRNERIHWIAERIRAARDLGATFAWPADLVTPKAALAGATVTDADVERMCAIVDAAEKMVAAPFPPEDPTTPEPPRLEPAPARPAPPPKPDEGRQLTDAERDELKAWVAANTTNPDVAAIITATVSEAGRDLAVAANPTIRRRALAMALVSLAKRGTDTLRAAVALVIPEAGQESVPIGGALAVMTLDEATQLLAIVEALDAGEPVAGMVAA